MVLSGGSAGGVATFFWADYIKNWLGSAVKFAGIPDSGYIYDTENDKTKTHLTQIQLLNLYALSNNEVPMPNQKCVDFFFDKQWRCMITSDLVNFIETNLFITHSEYDAWFIPNSLGIECIKDVTLSKCSKA